MYHSVNMFYVLISTDGESEYLNPAEKALRQEEVTILSNYVFFQEVKYKDAINGVGDQSTGSLLPHWEDSIPRGVSC